MYSFSKSKAEIYETNGNTAKKKEKEKHAALNQEFSMWLISEKTGTLATLNAS